MLVLGIGGGFLVALFVDAQRKIGELSVQVQKAQSVLAGQLTEAKKDFDSHVGQNPVVATLQSKVAQFETALANPDAVQDGEQGQPKPRGDGDHGEETIVCPRGAYVYGIHLKWKKGGGAGIVNHVSVLYKPFLRK